ncbi:50S ribosomal protein L19 [Ignicoccus islandicus DSM 13165]|uniref:Large ribosomal subunit protein eL19 n=1 Tax=Ignicoccus islandicus DSM 13165 TaxID=940295 RepID=A0A0U2WK88_9CREN|nr:50S ribosomal protein L19e [Ignicoccus islandicus]ALU11377.1 50S ribosomal protein L19 [Ignicoccus islandicus DSM 13165]
MRADKVARLAASVAGVGESRIWIDPTRLDELNEVVSKADVRKLMEEGVIKVLPERGNSRSRWKVRHEQRKKGRRRGYGKRKGKATARTPKKEVWMNKIRKIRRFLKYLRDKGVIDRRTYRELYRKAKGGEFDSLRNLKLHLRERYGIEVK